MIHANAYRGHIVCPPLKRRPKAWTAPATRAQSRKGQSIRRFTLKEDATIVDMRARGAEFDEIALVLGRSYSSVWYRHQLLSERAA